MLISCRLSNLMTLSGDEETVMDLIFWAFLPAGNDLLAWQWDHFARKSEAIELSCWQPMGSSSSGLRSSRTQTNWLNDFWIPCQHHSSLLRQWDAISRHSTLSEIDATIFKYILWIITLLIVIIEYIQMYSKWPRSLNILWRFSTFNSSTCILHSECYLQ